MSLSSLFKNKNIVIISIYFILALLTILAANLIGNSKEEVILSIALLFLSCTWLLKFILPFFLKQKVYLGPGWTLEYIEHDKENNSLRRIIMIFFIVLYILFMFLWGLLVFKDSNTHTSHLSAPYNEYKYVNIGKSTDQITIKAKFKLISEEISQEKPASASIGFYDRRDKSNNIQFVLQRDDSNSLYTVNYVVTEDGQVKEKIDVAKTNKDELFSLKMEYNNGTLIFTVENRDPVNVYTNLSEVIPFKEVSSGRAEFKITKLR